MRPAIMSFGRRCGAVVIFSGAVLLASSDLAFGEARVSGDAEMLTTVRRSLMTNQESHPSGRMRVKCYGAGQWPCDYSGTYVWSLDNERWDLTEIKPIPGENADLGIVGDAPPEQSIAIRTSRFLLVHFPDRKEFTQDLRPRQNNGRPPWFMLLPKLAWYCMRLEEGLKFEENLNPQDQNLKSIAIESVGDGVVDVAAEYNDSRMTFTCDRSVGWNVTKYASVYRGVEGYDGEFAWTADGAGGWYPREIRHEWDQSRWKCTIEEFDPLYEPPPRLFSVDSLQLPPGTRITEIGGPHGDRSWKIRAPGGEQSPKTISQSILDVLISVSRSGFAGPQREITP